MKTIEFGVYTTDKSHSDQLQFTNFRTSDFCTPHFTRAFLQKPPILRQFFSQKDLIGYLQKVSRSSIKKANVYSFPLQYNRAILVLKECSRMKPDNPTIHLQIADICFHHLHLVITILPSHTTNDSFSHENSSILNDFFILLLIFLLTQPMIHVGI